MSDFREEEALGKAYDARLARRLMQYLRPYKGLVYLAMAVTLLVAPLEAAGPYLFKVATDKYILPAFHGAISVASGFHGLGLVALAFLASLVLSFAFQYLQMRIMQDVGQKTMYDMRKQIFGHLQALPMS